MSQKRGHFYFLSNSVKRRPISIIRLLIIVDMQRQKETCKFIARDRTERGCLTGCLHDPANVKQTSSKCTQNTRANAGRLLDRVNTPLSTCCNKDDATLHRLI